jgi:predicted acylesterase/phospholipase RssA
VLVMQGGGAQAAYEGGVYEALHEAGIEPDWVIGTSIGAINGSIIAGNEVKSRLKRLREFWSRIESRPTWPSGPMFGNAANQLTTLLTGVPGFFSPNTAFLWGPEAAVGVEHAALYSVDPLRKLLPELVDFDLANSGKPRFTLGLVGVRSGRIRYFDRGREDRPRSRAGIERRRRRFRRSGSTERPIGTGASTQTHRSRSYSTTIRGGAASSSRYRSGTREARNPNLSPRSLPARRTLCLAAGP